MLDSRPRGHGFEPPPYHCVVALSKTHLSLLITGSTQGGRLVSAKLKIVDWDVKNQIKQSFSNFQTPVCFIPRGGQDGNICLILSCYDCVFDILLLFLYILLIAIFV